MKSSPNLINRLVGLPHGVLAGFALMILASCDVQPGAASAKPDQAPAPTRAAQVSRERQVTFLNRIRDADPAGRTIDRALLNDQNELGLVLDRSVEMEKIPALMRTMLTQMAKEFPGEDLTVVAYAPSTPPRKIGTALLNARTRDMTYTPEQ